MPVLPSRLRPDTWEVRRDNPSLDGVIKRLNGYLRDQPLIWVTTAIDAPGVPPRIRPTQLSPHLHALVTSWYGDPHLVIPLGEDVIALSLDCFKYGEEQYYSTVAFSDGFVTITRIIHFPRGPGYEHHVLWRVAG